MTPQLTPQNAIENLKLLAKAANKAGLIEIETVPMVLASLEVLDELVMQNSQLQESNKEHSAARERMIETLHKYKAEIKSLTSDIDELQLKLAGLTVGGTN